MTETDSFTFEFSDPTPTKPKKQNTFGANAPKRGPGRPPSKATVERELAEQITMLITVVSMPISMKDPHCGPVLAENAKPIAEALAAQAINSPTMMKWLEAITAPTGWVGVGMAFFPVARAIAEHHILPVFSRDDADDHGHLSPTFLAQ